MKKILIGLFLVASLSVLGAKNQTSNTANNVKYEKYPIDHEITYIEGHYEIDPKYEDMYSKEKKDFKDKYTTYNEKKDYKINSCHTIRRKYWCRSLFCELCIVSCK